jgi:transcriptional regulator with XRE-family HTH domain
MAKAALTQEQWAEVRRLRDELDLTTETIAARMGVHPRTIERRAVSEGWLLRAPGPKSPRIHPRSRPSRWLRGASSFNVSTRPWTPSSI